MTMTSAARLSVDTAVAPGSADRIEEEKENAASPLGSKRKSELISPSSRRASLARPLADVNSAARSGGGRSSAAPAKKPARTTPPTPLRTSLPPLSGNRRGSSGKFHPSASKTFHAKKPPRESIQATDDTRAGVGELSEWLAASAKKKKKQPSIHRPIPPPSGSSGGTPSFVAKPRIKREEVEATDSKRVSVKKLAGWMSDDPFETRKAKTIRSGARVIAKSRAFEKDKVSVALRKECGSFVKGSVEERQAWLSEAFHRDDEEVPQPLREAKVRPYQIKKKAEEEEEEVELKSVSDKKAWLSNAFKKGGEEDTGTPDIRQAKSFEGRSGGTPSIHPAKSFEGRSGASGTPSVRQAKSFESNSNGRIAGTPSAAAKCSSADHAEATPLARMHAGMMPSTAPCARYGRGTPTLDRQRSVVRLYRGKSEEEEGSEEEEEEFRNVKDRHAWLSSAFKKRRDAGEEHKSPEEGRGPEAGAKAEREPEEEEAAESGAGAARTPEEDEAAEEEEEGAAETKKNDGPGRPNGDGGEGHERTSGDDADGKEKEEEEEETKVEAPSEREGAVPGGIGGFVPPSWERPIEKKEEGDNDADDGKDPDNMSVAERARWLRGAFQK